MKAAVINCVTVTSNLLPEQVGMVAGTRQSKIVAAELVDAAIAVSAPIAGHGLIIEAGRKRVSGNQQAQYVSQFRHVLAPPLVAADIPAELPSMNHVRIKSQV